MIKINWKKFCSVTLVLFGSSVLLYIWIWINKAENQVGGDEIRYLNSFLLFKDGEYNTLFENGFSLPYLIFNILVSFGVKEDLLILRTTSIISGILLIITGFYMVFRILKIPRFLGVTCIVYIINLIALRPDFLFGVNEYLLYFFGFVITVYVIKKNNLKTKKFIITGSLFGIAILTRPMAVSYLGVFLLSIFLVTFISDSAFSFKKVNWKGILAVISACCLTILIFNSYSLFHYGHLTWENKELNGNINWAQYDYYNVLMQNQGVISRGQHASISDVEEYLENNSLESLPKNFLEMIYFDWSITFKEFFIDYFQSIKYLVRLTGIFYLYIIYILIKEVLNKEKRIEKPILIWLIFSIIFPVSISFLIVSNIQPRWFMFFLPGLMCIYFFLIQQLRDNLKFKLITLNNLLLFIANLPFLIKNFHLLII